MKTGMASPVALLWTTGSEVRRYRVGALRDRGQKRTGAGGSRVQVKPRPQVHTPWTHESCWDRRYRVCVLRDQDRRYRAGAFRD